MNVEDVDTQNYIDLTGEDEEIIVETTNPIKTTQQIPVLTLLAPEVINLDEEEQLSVNLQCTNEPDDGNEDEESGEFVLNPSPAELRKKKFPEASVPETLEESAGARKKSPKIAVVKGQRNVSPVKPPTVHNATGEKEDILSIAEAAVKEVQQMLPFRFNEDVLKERSKENAEKARDSQNVICVVESVTTVPETAETETECKLVPQTHHQKKSNVQIQCNKIGRQVGTVRLVQRSTGLTKVVPLTRTPPPAETPVLPTAKSNTVNFQPGKSPAVDPNKKEWMTVFDRELRKEWKGCENPNYSPVKHPALKLHPKQALLVKPQISRNQRNPLWLNEKADEGAEAVKNIPASASTSQTQNVSLAMSSSAFVRNPASDRTVLQTPYKKFVLRPANPNPKAETVTSQNSGASSGKALSDIIETAAAVAGIPNEEVPESLENNVVYLLCPVGGKNGHDHLNAGGIQQMLALVPTADTKVPEKTKPRYKRLDEDLLPLPGMAKAGKTAKRKNKAIVHEAIEPESTEEENRIIETAVLIKHSETDDDVKVLEECPIQPTLIKTVDINEIIKAGKKPNLPSRCNIPVSDENYCKGFTRNETRRGFCQKFLPRFIEKEEAIIKKKRLRVKLEYESNFISCGPVNSYFLPEMIKQEVEDPEVDADGFKLPTLGEVVSQVTKEARSICARTKRRDTETEKALKLIKKGLEMIQRSSEKKLEQHKSSNKEYSPQQSSQGAVKPPTSPGKGKRQTKNDQEAPPVRRKRMQEIQRPVETEKLVRRTFEDGDDLLLVRKIQIVRNPEQARGRARGRGRRRGRGWSSST